MTNQSLTAAGEAYWQRVARARQMSGEERMMEGIRMFDRECEAMRLEILQANPNFSEDDAQREVRRQLHKARLLEEAELSSLMSTRPPK